MNFRNFLFVCLAILIIIYVVGYTHLIPLPFQYGEGTDYVKGENDDAPHVPAIPPLDVPAYIKKLVENADKGTSTPALIASFTAYLEASSTSATTTVQDATSTPVVPPWHRLWPVKTALPNGGALLPFNRIIAYYGNFYSTQMGVLGEYPADVMEAKLEQEVTNWETADPNTPVIPAIDYIAVTAQGSAGQDHMYRLRMPADQIDHALDLADQVHGILILEVQAGLSDLQTEITLLEPYLKLPQVELAIDPEFAMADGEAPGTVIGTVSGDQINAAANYLAGLVRQYDLPPKILLVQRFTEAMVTDHKKITPLPEVQIVMDMDGWGDPNKKIGTYNAVIYPEPVQFTGFKLFYKNDLRPPSTRLLTPEEILRLTPQPVFIQYQ